VESEVEDEVDKTTNPDFWVKTSRVGLVIGIFASLTIIAGFLYSLIPKVPNDEIPEAQPKLEQEQVRVEHKGVKVTSEKKRNVREQEPEIITPSPPIKSVITNVVLNRCDIGNFEFMPNKVRTQYDINRLLKRLPEDESLWLSFDEKPETLQLRKTGKANFFTKLKCHETNILNCDGDIEARGSLSFSSNTKRLLLEFSSPNSGQVRQAFYSADCK